MLGIRRREWPRFGFFAGLLAFVGAAQAVGTTATEALLLGLLGVRALPATLLLASLGAAAGSLAYAATVGRLRHDRLLGLMLVGLAAMVLLGWAVLGRWPDRAVLPALFSLSSLAVAVLGNHFWVLAGDSFDPLAQKRVFPRLALGTSLGGFAGGLLASLLSPALGARALLGLWALLLVLAALLVGLSRRRLAAWSFGPPLAGETLGERVLGSVRFLRRSSLARGMLTMLVGMVLCLAMAQYAYSDLFARHFERPERLAAFLGVLVATAYLVEIPFLLGVTPWLLQRAGVPLTGLLHPALAVLAFLALGLDYSLLAAIFAWSVHRMFQNCLGSPARTLVYNAFPGRYRARLRAFLEGVVSYAARALAGGLLLLSSHVLLPGLLLALFYLAGAMRVRRAYLGALLEDITRGGLRADLELPPERLARMGEAALEAGDLAPLGARAGGLPVELLHRALGHPSVSVRRIAARALGPAAPASVLEDPAPEVRGAALVGAPPEARRRLLADPDPGVRALAAASLPGEGRPVLEALMRQAPAEALRVLPSEWAELARPLVGSSDPAVAALAVERAELSLERLERLLGHPAGEVRRAAALVLSERRDPLAAQILAGGLADPSREVRLQAARGLARSGSSGARAAEARLRSPEVGAVEAAVLAAGEEALRRELGGLLAEAGRDMDLLCALEVPLAAWPAEGERELAARFLLAALRDRLQRARRLALAILERLEGAEAVGGVRRRLRVGGTRERAEALEALSNLGDRASAAALVELLDEHPSERPPTPAGLENLLAGARHSLDPRVRLAARGVSEGWPAGTGPRVALLLALRQLPLLASLTLDELEGLLAQGALERFAPGEVLFAEGAMAERFYVLLSGLVHHGREVAPVAILGEIGALDGGPRRRPAVALERSELVSWPATRLRSAVRDHPELALELFRSLTGRLREAERQLS